MRFKSIGIVLMSVVLLSACSANEEDYKSDVPISTSFEVIQEQVVDANLRDDDQESVVESVVSVDEMNLDVPFFSQAPDGDWGLPWQEACEEASIVLAYHYATGLPLSLDDFRQEILDLVDWQERVFGAYEHTDIQQTAQMLEEHMGFTHFRVERDPSVKQMKQWISQGQVVVAPFAGRELGNPFYSNEGPYYHMMVIKGFDEEHFITNDVGTRRGHNFIYPYDTLMDALHEWHDEDITKGQAAVIVLEPASLIGGAELDSALVE